MVHKWTNKQIKQKSHSHCYRYSVRHILVSFVSLSLFHLFLTSKPYDHTYHHWLTEYTALFSNTQRNENEYIDTKNKYKCNTRSSKWCNRRREMKWNDERNDISNNNNSSNSTEIVYTNRSMFVCRLWLFKYIHTY